nr:uncharacterized protein I303_07396 [Kwoniella dejecticola CBS 10117]OBR82634.1 hypothetical protein I303_07396 [Kwoniella dejecticola CBS 10117]
MAASIHCADNAIESSDEEPDDLTACCDMAQTLLPNESRAEVKTRVNTYFTALTKERKSQGLTEEPSKDELQAMLRAHLQSTESKG